MKCLFLKLRMNLAQTIVPIKPGGQTHISIEEWTDAYVQFLVSGLISHCIDCVYIRTRSGTCIVMIHLRA